MTQIAISITASARAPKETKKDGCIPAVFYGSQTASTPIFINAAEFSRAFAQAGESSTVTLVTEKGNETALIHDVQLDPVKSHPVHIDFYVVEKGQKVHVKVPIVFVGESPATKVGGVVVKVMYELSLEAEPHALPHEISIDVSTLTNLDSAIHARDIALPAGVALYHVADDEVIAAISAQKEESETPVEVDLSAIEVEQKGKKEEDTPAAE